MRVGDAIIPSVKRKRREKWCAEGEGALRRTVGAEEGAGKWTEENVVNLLCEAGGVLDIQRLGIRGQGTDHGGGGIIDWRKAQCGPLEGVIENLHSVPFKTPTNVRKTWQKAGLARTSNSDSS